MRRRPVSAYAVLLVALGLLGGVYAALAPSGHASTQSANSTQIEAGKRLFQQGCSSCHGLKAQGSDKAPSLIGVGGAAVDFQVGTGRMPLARNGPQAAPKKVRYTQDEIDQLAAYVASLSPSGPAVPMPDELQYKDADIAQGGDLFRTNCASCHNFAGQGGALAHGTYAPSLSGTSAKHIYEAMLTGPENMPVFGDQQLSPQDKLKIIHYLKNVQAEADPGGQGLGRLGPVTEGLVGWLVGIGALVILTLWIGARA